MIPANLEKLLQDLNAGGRAHTGQSLYDHLVGTYELLKAWDNPDAVCIAGLFHSVYGTQFYEDSVASLANRERVRNAIGNKAEELAFLFCVSDRTDFWKNPGSDEITLVSRVDGRKHTVSKETRQALLELEIANTIEQVQRGFGGKDGLEQFREKINAFQDQLSPNALRAIRDILVRQTGANGRNGLAELLAPLEPDCFSEEFFGKKPLYIKGSPQKFGWLFSFERLKELLATSKELRVRASFDGGRTQVHVLPPEAIALYDAGATICVNDLASVDEGLSKFAASVRRQLNFCGNADLRAYLSPDKKGYDIHFDSRIATTLQIEGKKRWRFSREVALPWPYYQVRSGQGGALVTEYRGNQPGRTLEAYRRPSDCTFEEVVLEPGDVLCLPAGSWHSAEAQGRSLALNLAFEATTFWDLLSPILQSAVESKVQWRQPPAGLASTSVHRGSLPAVIETFFKQNIRQLIDILEALGQDPAELNQAWHRTVIFGDRRAPPSISVAKTRSLKEEDRLRLSSRAAVAYGFGSGPSGERLVFIYGTDPPFETGYSIGATSFFRNLLTQDEFDAFSATDWTDDDSKYSWATVKSLLEDLLACGVVDCIS